jgi:hypothetical protein
MIPGYDSNWQDALWEALYSEYLEKYVSWDFVQAVDNFGDDYAEEGFRDWGLAAADRLAELEALNLIEFTSLNSGRFRGYDDLRRGVARWLVRLGVSRWYRIPDLYVEPERFSDQYRLEIGHEEERRRRGAISLGPLFCTRPTLANIEAASWHGVKEAS